MVKNSTEGFRLDTQNDGVVQVLRLYSRSATQISTPDRFSARVTFCCSVIRAACSVPTGVPSVGFFSFCSIRRSALFSATTEARTSRLLFPSHSFIFQRHLRIFYLVVTLRDTTRRAKDLVEAEESVGGDFNLPRTIDGDVESSDRVRYSTLGHRVLEQGEVEDVLALGDFEGGNSRVGDRNANDEVVSQNHHFRNGSILRKPFIKGINGQERFVAAIAEYGELTFDTVEDVFQKLDGGHLYLL